MEKKGNKNITVHISSRSHLNLTFNLYQCGISEILPDNILSIPATDTLILIYINNGKGKLETSGFTFGISKNQGLFAFNDQVYKLSNNGKENLEITWLSFSGYRVENYLNRSNIYRSQPLFTDEDGFIGEKLTGLYEVSQNLPNRYCRMAAALYEIFGHLRDKYPEKTFGADYDNAEFYCMRAANFIENNYEKDISVDDIVGALGISRKYLYAVFNSVMKITPWQYLIYYRIEKASLRLKSSSQSIMEIAESVGYANQFYFAKEFKRITGMTPSEYRKDPEITEVFSYRTFLSTLQENLREESRVSKIYNEEQVFTVYRSKTEEEEKGEFL